MSIFKSGNPTLSDKKFRSTVIPDILSIDRENTMTVRGTLQKFGFLFLMTMGTAFFAWTRFAQGNDITPILWIGGIGATVIGLIISFKPTTSPYLAP